MIPTKVFFTKGVGRHKDYLQSFELALRDAGIEYCNLVYVSSIFPPGAKMVSRELGVKDLKPGQITFCVMARNSTNEPNRLVAASIGLAIPADSSQYGYLSEHHSFGETDQKAGEYAEELAATMLASTLGIEFDPNINWDEREQLFKMSGKIIKTKNITQSSQGHKEGMWTTVIAAAVFIIEPPKQADALQSPENGKASEGKLETKLGPQEQKAEAKQEQKDPKADYKLKISYDANAKQAEQKKSG
jgi:arginine decarboxylase